MFIQHTIAFKDLALDFSKIWDNTGNSGYIPDSETQQLFEDIVKDLSATCQPQYGYAIFPNDGIERISIRIQNKTLQTGAIITRYLQQAENFALFVATAGIAFEAMQTSIRKEEDIIKQYLLDMLGSEITEATAQHMAATLETEQIAKGYHTSNNYSPGYCGWPLTDQKTLFSLLPSNPCGITLTPSNLMLPIKSVSGIIAIGPKVEKAPYGCAICSKTDCYKNRLRKNITNP